MRNASLLSIEKLAKALQYSFSTLFEPFNDSQDFAGLSRQASDKEAPLDILLVQPNAEEAQATLETFRKAGLRNRVQVFAGGTELFEYLDKASAAAQEANRLKMIVLDVGLPKAGGTEVLRQLKNDERTRNIPVIALTAAQKSAEAAESRLLGANAQLVKPLDFHQFCEVMPSLSCHWILYGHKAPIPAGTK